MIGRIEEVPLREVWPYEVPDFNRWLIENPDLLAKEIGKPIFVKNSEAAAGNFNVDILAEDAEGNAIVIENQLERSDHQHLGQLITYARVLRAAAAIWIVAEARPEHVEAVEGINESGLMDFYLVRVETVRIGQSDPAPLFSLIAGPKAPCSQAPSDKPPVVDRENTAINFWMQFLDQSHQLTPLFRSVSPSRQSWLSVSAGAAGISYFVKVQKEDTTIGVMLRRSDPSESRMMFEFLQSRKDQIEAQMGSALEWDRMDGKPGCRIRHSVGAGGYGGEPIDMLETAVRSANAMARLEQAVGPFLREAVNLNKII